MPYSSKVFCHSAEFLSTDCYYAECHCEECHSVKWHSVNLHPGACHFAQCQSPSVILLRVIMLHVILLKVILLSISLLIISLLSISLLSIIILAIILKNDTGQYKEVLDQVAFSLGQQNSIFEWALSFPGLKDACKNKILEFQLMITKNSADTIVSTIDI